MNTFHEVEMPDHGLAEACRFRAVRNRTASTSHAGLLRGSLNMSNILDRGVTLCQALLYTVDLHLLAEACMSETR